MSLITPTLCYFSSLPWDCKYDTVTRQPVMLAVRLSMFQLWPSLWDLWWTKCNSNIHSPSTSLLMGRGTVVGIETRYGLDEMGIESRWGRNFLHPSRPALGPTQPPVQWVSGLFLEDKADVAWRWPRTPSSAEVKERVELYLYSYYGPSWPVLG
jgi:hypothetical protein